MQFGLAQGRGRIEAFPGGRATCPGCGKGLLARCGSIKVRHWAHLADQDCDPWYEHESEWHRSWKALVPLERVEVVRGPHRAVIVAAKGWVCELQHSAITVEEIAERERFYGRMVWLLDASAFADRLYVMERYQDTSRLKIRWTWTHSRWRSATKPVYLDLGQRTVAQLFGAIEGTYDPHRDISGRAVLRRRSDRGALLPEWPGSATLLRLKTLHRNGWGSADAIDRASFVQSLTG